MIEKLIKWLKNDGYKIMTKKNIPKKFSIDVIQRWIQDFIRDE